MKLGRSSTSCSGRRKAGGGAREYPGPLGAGVLPAYDTAARIESAPTGWGESAAFGMPRKWAPSLLDSASRSPLPAFAGRIA